MSAESLDHQTKTMEADEKLAGSVDIDVGDYIDPAQETKLLAKLDGAFVPIIMIVYLSCL